MYKLINFDLDGTLMDTSEGIIKSAKYAMDKFGLPYPSEKELEGFIGPPIQESFKSYYNLDQFQSDEMAACFRKRYSDIDLLLAKPYKNIFKLLEMLKSKDITLCVATNKRFDYATKLLKEFGFDTYINRVYGTDFEGKLHKTDLIKTSLEEYSVKPMEALMVGDTEGDETAAKIAGTEFIGVLYGFGFNKQTCTGKSGIYVKSPLDILEYIEG